MDFTVGVSIFLFALVFVFAFVPGTLQPFTQGAQDETAGADRVADLMVKDLLADPGEPYVLDGACTAALLSNGPGSGCGFDGSTLSTRLDLASLQSINVTMRGDPNGGGIERLCWDSSDEEVVVVGASGCTHPFVTGKTPPRSSDSVVTARRVVTIEGTTAAVEVRLW